MELTEIEIEYLATQRLGRLATVGPDGGPQNNPVGFAYDPGTGTIGIRGFNLASSRKFRNLAHNDRVAFVVDDLASVSPWRVRGIEIRGRAETAVVPLPSGGAGTDDIIRIHPHTVFTWGMEDDGMTMSKRTDG